MLILECHGDKATEKTNKATIKEGNKVHPPVTEDVQCGGDGGFCGANCT